MPDDLEARLASLTGAARRLLDYVAVLEGGARYETMRHLARVSEEDMVDDLREVVRGGFIAALPGRPNFYDFTDEAARERVVAEIGEVRFAKLRSRALGAKKRVEGD